MTTTTTFTAKDVQELRQRTGAGMMECKKALEETKGNMDSAIELLRKKGIAKAEKRAGRAASEGKIVARVSPDGKTGVLVEVNSETDFVARNEGFGKLVDQIADTIEEARREAPARAAVEEGEESTYSSDRGMEAAAGDDERKRRRRPRRRRAKPEAIAAMRKGGAEGEAAEGGEGAEGGDEGEEAGA